MLAKDTKPYSVSEGTWRFLWASYPKTMQTIYDISQELPGYVGMRHQRITQIIEKGMCLEEGSKYYAAILLWRDVLLKNDPTTYPEDYYPGPGQGAPPRIIKLFYKRIRKLISIYQDMGQEATPESGVDLSSRYYGIATGLRQVENYLSNHEPWNVSHLVLDIVINQNKITRTQEANKDVVGFNMVFSRGEEEALSIIKKDLLPLFLPPTRQIVICRG